MRSQVLRQIICVLSVTCACSSTVGGTLESDQTLDRLVVGTEQLPTLMEHAEGGVREQEVSIPLVEPTLRVNGTPILPVSSDWSVGDAKLLLTNLASLRSARSIELSLIDRSSAFRTIDIRLWNEMPNERGRPFATFECSDPRFNQGFGLVGIDVLDGENQPMAPTSTARVASNPVVTASRGVARAATVCKREGTNPVVSSDLVSAVMTDQLGADISFDVDSLLESGLDAAFVVVAVIWVSSGAERSDSLGGFRTASWIFSVDLST